MLLAPPDLAETRLSFFFFFCPRFPFFFPKQFNNLQLTFPTEGSVNMEEDILSDGLHGLYQDLSSIPELPLLNIDRLCVELETHIADFKRLLDKSAKHSASRQAVLSGKQYSLLTMRDSRCALRADLLRSREDYSCRRGVCDQRGL